MAETFPEALTDEELMLILCNATEARRSNLFNEVFRRYQNRVISWCYRLTRNQSCAIDLAQEIFFKAYRHMHGFRGDSRLSTWLYAITRNHCLSFVRKTGLDPLEHGESVPPKLRDISAAEADADIERMQLNRRMCEMLSSALDPLEARVMTMHYGYEMSLAAITLKLGLSNPSGAKAYIVNARRKLKALIQRRSLTRELSQHPTRSMRQSAAA